MNEPTVSVCIPVYNGEPYIGEALTSVLTQSFTDLEVVVVDNASTDRTLEVVAACDDGRLRVVRNETNIGAEGNWNRALSLAGGRYVKLLCADDTILPGCLEQQVRILDAEPGVVLVAGQRHIVDDSGNILFRGRGLASLDGAVAGEDAIRATVASGTNIFGEVACALLRRSDVARTGPFTARWPYMIDLEYWCRILRLGHFYAMRSPVATFRVAPGSWSAAIGREQSRQAAALFRHLAADMPGVVGRRQVWLGTARAAALAAGRQVTYRAWARRRRA